VSTGGLAHILPCKHNDRFLTIWQPCIVERNILKPNATQCLANFPDSAATAFERRQDFGQARDPIGVGVILVNRSGTILVCNAVADKLFKLTPGSAIGQPFNQVLGSVPASSGALNFFALRSLSTEHAFDLTITPRPGVRRHLKIQVVSNTAEDGQGGGYVLTLQDLTGGRRDAQAIQRRRTLRIIKDVAARIAHEIRNPLGSIALFASSIGAEPDVPAGIKKLTGHIAESVESINTIVENLLFAVSPAQKPDFGDIDLHTVLEDTLFFSGHLFASNQSVQVATCFSETALNVWGDHQLLKQAVLNLILNAIQAMPQGGTLTVSTRQARAEDGMQLFAEVRVADTGVGIAETELGRVCDPYYTTKANGTGLGMAIVQNIVSSHRGTLDIVSQPEHGTACIIRLPLKSDTADHMARRARTAWPLNPITANQASACQALPY
jgi:signal transduction histidine kinase